MSKNFSARWTFDWRKNKFVVNSGEMRIWCGPHELGAHNLTLEDIKDPAWPQRISNITLSNGTFEVLYDGKVLYMYRDFLDQIGMPCEAGDTHGVMDALEARCREMAAVHMREEQEEEEERRQQQVEEKEAYAAKKAASLLAKRKKAKAKSDTKRRKNERNGPKKT